MITLQLNQNQAEVLLGLIDIATKSGGLNVAEAAVFFSKQVQEQIEALNAENAPPAEESTEESTEEK